MMRMLATARGALGFGRDADAPLPVRNRRLQKVRRVADYDQPLVWTVILLLVFGLVMVYSSSIAIAEGSKVFRNQSTYFLVRHALYIVVALAVAAACFQIPMKAWQEIAPWAFIAGLVLLVAVLVLGREINGAKRWISLGFMNLQPSELMKVFVVLYAADYTVRKAAVMHSLTRGLLPMFAVMLFAGALLLLEPDFGALVVISAIAVSTLFIGGMNARWFSGLLVLLAIGFATLVVTSPYRIKRFFGFLDPWSDAFGKGYQLSHSLIAFGRGEWFGVGLGASIEKLHYLPEAHTDFILAVIAEELGFVGVLVVLAGFAFLVLRAFAIGRKAALQERPFPALVAYGVGTWLGVQAFINIGVNMGVLPTKGLTLPLMSYGGSGIVANCIALAILLRVDWESRQMQRGLPA